MIDIAIPRKGSILHELKEMHDVLPVNGTPIARLGNEKLGHVQHRIDAAEPVEISLTKRFHFITPNRLARGSAKGSNG